MRWTTALLLFSLVTLCSIHHGESNSFQQSYSAKAKSAEGQHGLAGILKRAERQANTGNDDLVSPRHELANRESIVRKRENFHNRFVRSLDYLIKSLKSDLDKSHSLDANDYFTEAYKIFLEKIFRWLTILSYNRINLPNIRYSAIKSIEDEDTETTTTPDDVTESQSTELPPIILLPEVSEDTDKTESDLDTTTYDSHTGNSEGKDNNDGNWLYRSEEELLTGSSPFHGEIYDEDISNDEENVVHNLSAGEDVSGEDYSDIVNDSFRGKGSLGTRRPHIGRVRNLYRLQKRSAEMNKPSLRGF